MAHDDAQREIEAVVRDGLVHLAREYLTEGVILGAASLGVELTHQEVRATLFAGDATADGQQKLRALILLKRAGGKGDGGGTGGGDRTGRAAPS